MPITLDFTGKLVLVTGGGRGIGAAISKALAKGGADIAITYTSVDASPYAAQLTSDHGITAKSFRCEVSSSAEVDAMLAEVEAAFGRKVDIGIANAGVSLWKDSHDNTDADFQRLFDVNVSGPFYLSRALVRSWLSLPIPVDGTGTSSSLDITSLKGDKAVNLGKQILFVSSISGLVAMTPQRQAAYNASKGAVTMLSKSLAAEWAHIGVMVNSVSPGYVLTDMIANPPDATASTWVSDWQARTPAGRFATPDEVGEFVALLVSDKQGGMGWMTGSDVVIDGGYTLL
ncbi:hypothetical protein EHS25_005853 [Saitozyma podzolica]|uniref:Sorbose reductase sou1 n=1 Tax=Saitozyma podzolica TaxID=1890683 RepID=A0A427XVK2_9TREE|nr:hypothetical protein EHS25_005853 [Saitozyma podzolica]